MLKKTITYKNFDDEEFTEDFYFNLTKAEVIEMNLSEKGGLEQYLKEIMASEDNREILRLFKDLFRLSYGKKSPDGKRFVKKPEYFAEFEETGAYSELVMSLFTDEKAGAAFVRGIVPRDLGDKIEAASEGPKKPQDRKTKAS